MRKNLFLVVSVFLLSQPIAAQAKEARVSSAAKEAAGLSGNGYIPFETKNVDEAYKTLQSALSKYEATIKSYNMSSTPDSRFKSINADISVDLQKGSALMNDLAQIGAVKNQSYNQYPQTGYDMPSLQKELAGLNDKLYRILGSSKSDIELLKMLITKITDAENRIKSVENNSIMLGKARINVNIQQKGYASAAGAAKCGVKGLLLYTLFTALIALGSFMLGLYANKIKFFKTGLGQTPAGN